ncbi:MAG TPA: ATP-binding protein [Burkholderiales bacterium]
MTSVRRQLLLWLLAAMLLAGVAASGATFYQARREADRLFDYHLRQLALSLTDAPFEEADIRGTLDEEAEFDFVIQVWDTEGVRLYFSRPHTPLRERTQPGYGVVTTTEGVWRVYTAQKRGLTVQVAQPRNVRNRLAAGLALRTLMPLLLMLPILGGLIWLIVGRGLSPLDRLSREVAARNPDALTPVSETALPTELRPLGHALNELLARLGFAMQTQREFVADAAHELRTPLTALQLQVQLARRARNDEERATAFTNLEAGLKRATHLVQQLLTLARQEPEAADEPPVAVDFAALAAQVVGEYATLAARRGIDLGLAHADAASVFGHESSLRALLANLVDNAIRYTPAGGQVDVALRRAGDRAVLTVRDTGPGIPAEERDRVFDRFYRRESGGVDGSGLGLAIVKAIAERHAATIALEDGPDANGLVVRISLPAIWPEGRMAGSNLPQRPTPRSSMDRTSAS